MKSKNDGGPMDGSTIRDMYFCAALTGLCSNQDLLLQLGEASDEMPYTEVVSHANQIAHESIRQMKETEEETCKWKLEDCEDVMMAETCEGSFLAYESDMIFCPYCGKRIMVKEEWK